MLMREQPAAKEKTLGQKAIDVAMALVLGAIASG